MARAKKHRPFLLGSAFGCELLLGVVLSYFCGGVDGDFLSTSGSA